MYDLSNGKKDRRWKEGDWFNVNRYFRLNVIIQQRWFLCRSMSRGEWRSTGLWIGCIVETQKMSSIATNISLHWYEFYSGMSLYISKYRGLKAHSNQKSVRKSCFNEIWTDSDIVNFTILTSSKHLPKAVYRNLMKTKCSPTSWFTFDFQSSDVHKLWTMHLLFQTLNLDDTFIIKSIVRSESKLFSFRETSCLEFWLWLATREKME